MIKELLHKLNKETKAKKQPQLLLMFAQSTAETRNKVKRVLESNETRNEVKRVLE